MFFLRPIKKYPVIRIDNWFPLCFQFSTAKMSHKATIKSNTTNTKYIIATSNKQQEHLNIAKITFR